MKLSLGIVGLPNVGKSTLFNALTKQDVLAANYPFATIDPNHGIVPVFDERLDKIFVVEKAAQKIPAVIEFVDIAGIVKGASEGEGLGNKFLSNIREVSAIVQVVRAFEDENITHVENTVDPARDIELINTELILKDLESVEGRINSLTGAARANPIVKTHLEYFEKLRDHLSDGNLANQFKQSTDDDIKQLRKELFLLTDKDVLYIANTKEGDEDLVQKIKDSVNNSLVIPMDIKQEAELIQLDDADRAEFMQGLGIEKSGLDILSEKAYDLLGLMSFFTSGPTESRAWTIAKGTHAPEAAGAIHTDIQENFIAADVVNWKDFVDFGGWNGSKENGKVRLEGKDYVMQDGDLVLFKHNG